MPTTKELLDSEGWKEVLEVFASSVNVAVALIDHTGQLIGSCHNATPIWSLARKARPDWGSGCIFCLDRNDRCTAAAEAERTRSPVMALGLGGFAHIATPIFLGDQHLGTLLAGQVFHEYPEVLTMGLVAREFNLSEQVLWSLARLAIPVSRASLTAYGNLLGTLGNAFVTERYSTILQRTLAETNTRLQTSNEDLVASNSKLNGKVAELDQSIAEKDILLNEIHHRVNNNLQVIASLLQMQAEAFPDERVTSALQESQLRVQSMALIHAQLYNSVNWSAVDFTAYTELLASSLFLSYGVDPGRITWRVEMNPFRLSVDKAIPAALILNEMISNALKHAFPHGRQGSILIRGELRDGRIELSVRDDGAGIAKATEPRQRQSLGLKIVDILCRQLKGTFEGPYSSEEPGAGSTFGISFPYVG